jgi:hypothetical protein
MKRPGRGPLIRTHLRALPHRIADWQARLLLGVFYYVVFGLCTLLLRLFRKEHTAERAASGWHVREEFGNPYRQY